ncbi:helicase domino isoform X2 [Bombyx mori]|uniref:Helicase domino n=1 Tax=Bombyx mori TaxID=7091 RepID=A0A8R2LXT4_BOMMO|nr:helicase domino [Bombyx mori]
MNAHDDFTAAPNFGAAPQLMGVERVGSCMRAINGGVGAGAAESDQHVADEPPRKRARVAAPAITSPHDLRHALLDAQLLRLRTLRDAFTEQLSELYFLQAGGNMMDYAAWRRQPPAPALLAFLESRRPAPPPSDLPPAPIAAPPITPADEVVEKAKQEAYVARRVAELARAGLWSERRLPRVLEPPRPKTHWDYLLEEMAWLAQDFAQERKWKKQAARKCARAVQKYFQDKALAAQKAEKAQEMQLKKIAAFAAKEIRTFWSNVEKLVEWKRVRRVERARKEALDEQLSYIVDRTERYSRQLAANLASAPASEPASAPPSDPPSDDEFTPRGASDDDEETIAAAEREAGDDDAAHRAELEALQRESNLELDALLPPGYLPERSPPPSDYAPDDDSADDETTIAEQERKERALDAADELDELKADADLDLDELRRRYSRPPENEIDLSDSAPGELSDDENTTQTDTESEADSMSSSEPLESLVRAEQTAGDSERRVEEAASLAATLQPTGTTLSETAVGTAVPRLLRHALREYQHVGLHWLATMHARGLNGILADEMGLGKTVQTIALLAHLALDRHDWGPHLVVAPTSVVLNWEMEFKKWCPAFKILTYYGTIKERKQKRVGWTKANSFHVCITSYKLVVQDHQSFRRKKWKYLVLDEAQNIKNFKSQRWQLLLNFQTERRLLLTGTPLQNSLLELWSLMHFLMPDVFASHSEFREWFAEVGAMAEGARYDEALVRRLHAVLRPFLLRRLKRDVERQMPRKYEHVLLCRLAKRQRFLYDDFMSRAKTKESLASGNLLSVINVLMQLRKVCNHPDLFEPRPVTSPLHVGALRYRVPALVLVSAVRRRTLFSAALAGDLAALELSGAGAFTAHRARHLAPPRRAFDEATDARRRPPPRPPPASLRLHLRLVPRVSPANAPPPPPVAMATARPPPAPRSIATEAAAPGSAAAARLAARRRACVRRLAATNERRCWRLPLYGADLRAAADVGGPPVPPRDLTDILTELHDVIDKFSICWMSARADALQLEAGAGAGSWRRLAALMHAALAPTARAALAALHEPASRQAVAFPHPSLLQYDCGKLQTLAALLRRLKSGGHRVLIFTQMTRVLDVLEAFLSMHGHTYLRLDGATRVDRRQPLVDRFNADARIFAFILSTRSGGVGLNLTGADSVVFYDSDWNPTMDAQAQDRCHRIGQTRDVHVYRLVTAATVEENILRKAEQKRTLGHLAIEDGNFTTSYLRGANIKELFGSETNVVTEEEGSGAAAGGAAAGGAAAGGELECALAAAEDEADVVAARAARAEAQHDLAEFDESLPLDDEPHAAARDPHVAQLAALMMQLTPIEKYAMRVVESGEAASEAERAALGEARRQQREWESARRRLREEAAPPSPALCYARADAEAQIWISGAEERMPMWCPPTPPSGDGDVYCESWARALYRPGAAPDTVLPPAPRREPRALRDQRRLRLQPRPAAAPPSLFERSGPRPRPRPRAPTHAPPPPHAQPDWSAAEDAALRRALRLQRLPAEPPPALAPNWDWVAELVNEAARAFRSARACRDRHDTLADPERARRRHRRPPAARRRPDDERPRPPLHRLDAVRDAIERRRSTPKRRLDDAPHRNPKHAQLLADHGVAYDTPPTPMEVAARRADRIAREKLKVGVATPAAAAATAPAPSPSPSASAVGAGVGMTQRVVVAAPVKADMRRARPTAVGESPRPAAVSSAVTAAPAAQLLYRQQAFPARHLKILHQAVPPSIQGAPSGGEGAALRKLQLQQVRRAASPRPPTPGPAPPAPPAPAHVVVAHLGPSAARPPPPPSESRQ